MAKTMGFEVQDQALLMFQRFKQDGRSEVNADSVITRIGLLTMPTWEESRDVWIAATKKCLEFGIDVVEFISWVMNDAKIEFKRYWKTIAKWIVNDRTFSNWIRGKRIEAFKKKIRYTARSINYEFKKKCGLNKKINVWKKMQPRKWVSKNVPTYEIDLNPWETNDAI